LRTKKFQTFWGLPVLSDSLCATGVKEILNENEHTFVYVHKYVFVFCFLRLSSKPW